MLSLVKNMKSEPFVHNLMEGSELLRELDNNFERCYDQYMKRCPIVSFYEMHLTKGIVVSGKHYRCDACMNAC